MTTSHYGTTGLLKNSQGQIVSQKVKFKVVLVYLALVLDNILLTVVVPIIPIFLYQNEALERNLTLQNSKGILDEFIEDEFIAEKSAKTEGLMVSENSRIGALFASKAFVQLIFNPLVGKATITFGYDIPFLIGTSFLLLSSLIFTFVTSFHWLFAARSLQGIASSSIAVSGMGMVANLFEEDTESEKSIQNQLEEGKWTISDDFSFVVKDPEQEENKTALGDKVPGKQTGDENEVGGSAEERKKRKHGNSASKLTPESKKVHVNENPQLLKELKKIEKEASKKDLTEVKKKVLKS